MWMQLTVETKCSVLGIPFRYLISLRRITIACDDFVKWQQLGTVSSNGPCSRTALLSKMVFWLRDRAPLISDISLRYLRDAFIMLEYPEHHHEHYSLDLMRFLSHKQKRLLKAVRSFRCLTRVNAILYNCMRTAAWPIFLNSTEIDSQELSECPNILEYARSTLFPKAKKAAKCFVELLTQGHPQDRKHCLLNAWVIWLEARHNKCRNLNLVTERHTIQGDLVCKTDRGNVRKFLQYRCQTCTDLQSHGLGFPERQTSSDSKLDKHELSQSEPTCNILSLPTDIRERIWKTVVTSMRPLVRCDDFHHSEWITNISRVCKLMFKECSFLFYRLNAFIVSVNKLMLMAEAAVLTGSLQHSSFPMNPFIVDLTSVFSKKDVCVATIEKYFGVTATSHRANLQALVVCAENEIDNGSAFAWLPSIIEFAPNIRFQGFRAYTTYKSMSKLLRYLEAPFDIMKSGLTLTVFSLAIEIPTLEQLDIACVGIEREPWS